MEKVKDFLMNWGVWLAVPVMLVGTIIIERNSRHKSQERTRKARLARRRNNPTSKRKSSGTRKNTPTRVRTKSGKLITGRENVLAYRRRLRNLAKGRKSRGKK